MPKIVNRRSLLSLISGLSFIYKTNKKIILLYNYYSPDIIVVNGKIVTMQDYINNPTPIFGNK